MEHGPATRTQPGGGQECSPPVKDGYVQRQSVRPSTCPSIRPRRECSVVGREPRAESRELWHRPSSCPPGRVMPRLSASGSRRPPESSPPVAGGSSSSSTSSDRASRLSAGTAWSRAVVRSLAAGFLLGVAALLALPLQAQAQTVTLVSNTGQADSGSRLFANLEYAQPFDTGSNSDGYNLASIVLDFEVAPTVPGTLTVTVRKDSSGDPSGTVLYTLTNPTLSAGSNEFSAPANAALDANATYWVVASYSVPGGGPTWYWTRLSNGLDTGAAEGWAIDAPYEAKVRSAQNGWGCARVCPSAPDRRQGHRPQRHPGHHRGRAQFHRRRARGPGPYAERRHVRPGLRIDQGHLHRNGGEHRRADHGGGDTGGGHLHGPGPLRPGSRSGPGP